MDTEKLLEEWKNRLGLSDWRIKLSINCEPQEMEIQDVVGCTSWQETTKTAKGEQYPCKPDVFEQTYEPA